MASVQGPLTSVPTIGTNTVQGTSPTSATAPTSAPQSTLGTASGFGSTSTFASSPAATSALSAINRAIPNLPDSVLQPLRDAAIAQVNAAMGSQPPLSASVLQTALNKAVNDFNVAVNGAINQQQLAAQRQSIIDRATAALNQKFNSVPAQDLATLRQAALANLNSLTSANPPLSNTALQTASDKLVRNFIDSANAAADRAYRASTVYNLLKNPDPHIDPKAFAQWRDAALAKVNAALAANPPMATWAFAKVITDVTNELRTNLGTGVQSGLAVDQALATMNQTPRLKLPAGSDATLKQLRDAYTQLLHNALGTTPPPTLDAIRKLTAQSLSDFQNDLTKLSKGQAVTIPNVPGTTTVGNDDAAARQALIDQGIAQITNMTQFVSLDGRTLDMNQALDPKDVADLKAIGIQRIKDLANQQPPPSLADLQQQIDAAVSKFKGDVAFQKQMNDFFIDWIIQQMGNNTSMMVEALQG